MRFSFVIPVYKKDPELFRDCLKSIKTQSYKDIEVVCVFDGKDDALHNVAKEELKEAALVTIKHGGACRARNEGFKHTSGDFVAFWDADCIAEPEMVKVWARYLSITPSLDFVYSGYRWLDPSAPPFESEAFDPWTLERYNYIASMFPCRREKVVEWDESLKSLQDWDYWRRIVKNGSVGEHIPGHGFATEAGGKESISGSVEDIDARIEVVRKKHGDNKRHIHVVAGTYRAHGLNIAKTLTDSATEDASLLKLFTYSRAVAMKDLLVQLYPLEVQNELMSPLHRYFNRLVSDFSVYRSSFGNHIIPLISEAKKKEADISRKEDKIEPFRFFLPLKGIAGYRENEAYMW